MVQKVARRSPDCTLVLPPGNWKILCQPSSKWVPFSNRGMIRQPKEWDGLRFPFAVPKIQRASNPCYPYGYYAMGAFTLCTLL